MKEKIVQNRVKIAVAALIVWNLLATGLIMARLPSRTEMQIVNSIANPQTFGLAVLDIMCRTELNTALSVCTEVARIRAEAGIQ